MRSLSFTFLAFSIMTQFIEILSEKASPSTFIPILSCFYPDFIQINLPTFIEYLEIWQTLKVQSRYLFLTLLGPPFDGSTIPCSTLLSFCSSPGAKAVRPLSGYPGLLPRWATLQFVEKLCRQKWCNIIVPKTIQNYGTQNDIKLWRQKLYKRFPPLRFDKK